MTTFCPSSTSGAIMCPATRAALTADAEMRPCFDPRERRGSGQWTHPECRRGGAHTGGASVTRRLGFVPVLEPCDLGGFCGARPACVAAIARRVGPVPQQAAKRFRECLPGPPAPGEQVE